MAYRGGGGGLNYKPVTVVIGNIPETCQTLAQRTKLQSLFEQHGKVVESKIGKRLGFVLYATAEEGKAAQEALDGHDFEGSNLIVEIPLNTYVLEEHLSVGTGGGLVPLDPYNNYNRGCYPPPAHYCFYRPPPPNTEIIYRHFADPYDRRPQYCDPYYREDSNYRSARSSSEARSRSRTPRKVRRSRSGSRKMYSQGKDLGAAGGAQRASSGTGASSMEEEYRQLKDQRECKICNEGEVEVVFIPCGHLVACEACAHKLKECPICRHKIESHVRTYLS